MSPEQKSPFSGGQRRDDFRILHALWNGISARGFHGGQAGPLFAL
jgi:hypothetical protein